MSWHPTDFLHAGWRPGESLNLSEGSWSGSSCESFGVLVGSVSGSEAAESPIMDCGYEGGRVAVYTHGKKWLFSPQLKHFVSDVATACKSSVGDSEPEE